MISSKRKHRLGGGFWVETLVLNEACKIQTQNLNLGSIWIYDLNHMIRTTCDLKNDSFSLCGLNLVFRLCSLKHIIVEVC